MGCAGSKPVQLPEASPKPTKDKPFTGDSANFETGQLLREPKLRQQPVLIGPAEGSEPAQPPLPAVQPIQRPPAADGLTAAHPAHRQIIAAEQDDASAGPNPLQGHRIYEKVGFIGDGGSGFVLLAINKVSQDLVAIKFLERGSPAIRIADREVLNMQMCSMHPNIIQFREVFLTPQYLALVCEYAEMGDMAEYIARRASGVAARALPEQHARALFQQLMLSVDFCHARGISNRDLKAENVLLSRITENSAGGQRTSRVVVKLCDFGFSKDERLDSVCKTACGTPEYIAPEVLLQGIYDGKTSDIWSAGVLLFVMLTGQYPFRLRSDERLNPVIALQQMFPRIMAADFNIPDWVSQPCRDLLRRMICADPDKRIRIEAVLRHPWFESGLPSGMLEMNATLLETPAHLHLGFMSQTESEIMAILQQAMHLPK